MAKSKQLPGQLDMFDDIGIAPKNNSNSQKKPCHLCDGHKGCDNCYYGQICEVLAEACYDCTPKMSSWLSLGDNYCRDCGRKLK